MICWHFDFIAKSIEKSNRLLNAYRQRGSKVCNATIYFESYGVSWFCRIDAEAFRILGESEKSMKRSLSSTVEIKMNTRNMAENRPHKNWLHWVRDLWWIDSAKLRSADWFAFRWMLLILGYGERKLKWIWAQAGVRAWESIKCTVRERYFHIANF